MVRVPDAPTMTTERRPLALALLALAACQAPARTPDAPASRADVVVYGGTSAGVAAAVRLARLGRSVIVVSPDEHLGGLSSSGLGFTDSGEKSVIGGVSREFYARIFDHYADDGAWTRQTRESYGNRGQHGVAVDGRTGTMWVFEPHVAEQAFEDMIAEAGVRVDRGVRLDRGAGGVEMASGGDAPRIASFRTLDGARYAAKVFVDATYEGDLMAAAGVSYHVGRESNDTYGETWNGVQPDARHHGHHFGVVDGPVDPYVVPGDPASGHIPLVGGDPIQPRGAGDDRVQSYCFRLCMTDDPENLVPFEAPEGYDPADYELVARVFEAGWRRTIPPFDRMPNLKTDTNNHGPVSFDFVGGADAYPEASYERRAEIVAAHERYQRGLLHFLRTSHRVPRETNAQLDSWGLAADEFVDNDNWPYQVYVREARRMVGDFVMTEHEVQGRRAVPEPIGMGSYVMDSHNVQRYVTPEGHVDNEGDVGVKPPGPYGIAYGAITPRREECANLLVPVCVSSSHIAFGSIRMEPVFMVLADSAAHAAHLAIEGGVAVQDVPYAELRAALDAAGQVCETPAPLAAELEAARAEREARSIDPASLEGLVIDDADATFEGAWTRSTASPRFLGPAYHHDGDRRDGALTATFEAVVPESLAGDIEVRLLYPYASNRATNARVTVQVGASDPVERTVDQRAAPPIPPLATPLGTFPVTPGDVVRVTLSNAGADGHVIADGVQIQRAP